MIINKDREPKYSLFYIGSAILEYVGKNDRVSIDDLYIKIKSVIDENLNIDFLYYSLDWLFILGKINLEGDRVIKC